MVPRSNCSRILITLSALLAVAACGGSDPTPPNNVLPSVCLDFAADPGQGQSSPEGAALPVQGSVCETVTVRVTLAAVNNVTTVRFTAAYNTAVASYVGHSLAGSRLTDGGTNVLEIDNSQPGMIDLGLTRPAPAPGVDFAAGGETVVNLTFRRFGSAASTSALTFGTTQVFDDGTPPTEIGGITWVGGTLRLN